MGSIEIRKEWKGMERNGKKERRKEGKKRGGGKPGNRVKGLEILIDP